MTSLRTLRKIRAAAAAAALVLGLGVGGSARAADRSREAELALAPVVTVESGEGGAYRVEGSFHAEATRAVAWSVLTDYDNLSSFVSSMKSSAARREAGRTVVSQEAVGKAGPFSRRLHVVLEIEEEAPSRIAFEDVGGDSFHSYRGAWAIAPDGAGVRVSYRLEARPRTSPPLFARSIVASNARGLLEQVRREMQRRDACRGGR